jgi:hypothetical protein
MSHSHLTKRYYDAFADITWMICRDSGMIQLKNLFPFDILKLKFNNGSGNWDKK